jgi:hypothetical protein
MTAPSQAEVKAVLVSLLPPGSDWYKLDNTAYIGGTINSLAGTLKDTLVDRIEVLRANCNPSTLTAEGLPELESATGLAYTPIALFGTTNQRRNAVLAALRMSGSFSLDDIRSIVQPYFLYQDSSQIVILETNRATIRTAHTYPFLAPILLSSPVTYTLSLTTPGGVVLDDPRISPAGAHLVMNVTGDVGDYTFTLTGPDGTFVNRPRKTFPSGSGTGVSYDVALPKFAGKQIRGPWTITVITGAGDVTVNSWGVFAEGIGVIYDTSMPPNRVGQGLGAPIFEFAVAADPALLGAGFDLHGAQRALTRWKPAHTLGVIASISPVTGTICAIPDTLNATPDFAIPC